MSHYHYFMQHHAKLNITFKGQLLPRVTNKKSYVFTVKFCKSENEKEEMRVKHDRKLKHFERLHLSYVPLGVRPPVDYPRDQSQSSMSPGSSLIPFYLIVPLFI